jgi:endonuclease I
MSKSNYFIRVLLLFIFLAAVPASCEEKDYTEEKQAIEMVASALFVGQDLKKVTTDLELPTYVDGVVIVWESDHPAVLSNLGEVTRMENDVILVLTAHLTFGGITVPKTFGIMVLGAESTDPHPQLTINGVAENLLSAVNLSEVAENLVFPVLVDGVAIAWTTADPDVITSGGIISRTQSNQTVTVSATLTYQELQTIKEFLITVLADSGNLPEYTGYYAGAEGLAASALKSFLHDLIDDHTEYTYAFAKTALLETDEDPNNDSNVILFYTGRSQAKTTFGTSSDQWNREHVWAKSHGGFSEVPPAGTDLHHLRPTDFSVNRARGNLDFDEGGTKVNDTYGINSSFCYADSDSFEPRDEVKGDVARIIFYMAVRYDGSDGVADLELNDFVSNGSTPFMGKKTVLLTWNELDPVDDFERNRNETIFGYQGNRNPFIDHPELADKIWDTETIILENSEIGFFGIPRTIADLSLVKKPVCF